jgi:hypothetical protein
VVLRNRSRATCSRKSSRTFFGAAPRTRARSTPATAGFRRGNEPRRSRAACSGRARDPSRTRAARSRPCASRPAPRARGTRARGPLIPSRCVGPSGRGAAAARCPSSASRSWPATTARTRRRAGKIESP